MNWKGLDRLRGHLRPQSWVMRSSAPPKVKSSTPTPLGLGNWGTGAGHMAFGDKEITPDLSVWKKREWGRDMGALGGQGKNSHHHSLQRL